MKKGEGHGRSVGHQPVELIERIADESGCFEVSDEITWNRASDRVPVKALIRSRNPKLIMLEGDVLSDHIQAIKGYAASSKTGYSRRQVHVLGHFRSAANNLAGHPLLFGDRPASNVGAVSEMGQTAAVTIDFGDNETGRILGN